MEGEENVGDVGVVGWGEVVVVAVSGGGTWWSVNMGRGARQPSYMDLEAAPTGPAQLSQGKPCSSPSDSFIQGMCAHIHICICTCI